jgi:hypothetical protein
MPGTLYLTVLSVNSMIALLRGTAKAPGEIPVWCGLALLTAATTALPFSTIIDLLQKSSNVLWSEGASFCSGGSKLPHSKFIIFERKQD